MIQAEKARPPPFMISYHPFYRDLNQQNGKSPGHCKAWPGDFYFLKVNFQAVSTVWSRGGGSFFSDAVIY